MYQMDIAMEIICQFNRFSDCPFIAIAEINRHQDIIKGLRHGSPF
jgi:hypothetical protein